MSAQDPGSPEMQRLRLEQKARQGPQWFFWIAGLSALNTIAWLTHVKWSFVMGLGITQLFDGIGRALGSGWVYVNAWLDLIVIATLVAIGIFARRQRRVYLVGIVLYALDGVLLFVLGDFFSFLFHGLAIAFMVAGLRAAGQLEREPAPASGQLVPPGPPQPAPRPDAPFPEAD